MSGGRPFGPTMPRHTPFTQGEPDASLSVGTSGKMAARFSAMKARLLTLPALIRARASGNEQDTKSTPSAARSVKAVAAPVLGTHFPELGATPSECSMPAIARCQLPPCPLPDAFSLPGLALISATRSLSLLYLELVCTWMAA